MNTTSRRYPTDVPFLSELNVLKDSGSYWYYYVRRGHSTFPHTTEGRLDALDFLNGQQTLHRLPFHVVTEREAEVLARLEATGKVGTREENLDTKPAEPRGKVAGFVYFIRNVRGNVKIGAAVNPLRRLRTFQTANDDNLELIGFVETDDVYETEQKLHRQYHHALVRGEWYNGEDVVVPS